MQIPYTLEDYERQKASEPDFYRSADSLTYGQSKPIPEDNMDKMVAELKDRQNKRSTYSRRRTHNPDKDVDFINSRNAHFNRKLERAYGEVTKEIKANLERGTALPK